MEVKHVVCETCGKEHLLCGSGIYEWASLHESNNKGHKVKIYGAPSRKTKQGKAEFNKLFKKGCKTKKI